MVFGFFKKDKKTHHESTILRTDKKKFNYNCPLCERRYFVEFNPEEITEWKGYHRGGQFSLSETTCEFCKAEVELIYYKDGEVSAWDKKWQAVVDKHDADISKIEKEIDDVGDKIDELEYDTKRDNKSKITALEKKQKALEDKQERIEEAYSNKEDKHELRRWKWQEKWADKLDKLEG